MKIYRIQNYKEYLSHTEQMEAEYNCYQDFQGQLKQEQKSDFSVRGFSYTAKKEVDFHVNYTGILSEDINWRETVICPITHLNNRTRAGVQIFDTELMPYPKDRIYLTEQISPLYAYFSGQNKYVVTGSEYLGNEVELGQMNGDGVRNEDLTRLTFRNEYFHKILSFDCFEHIEDYRKALSECFRVLKSGGKLLFSVPFDRNAEMNSIRARSNSDGLINHILEPEYHGDPINEGGCLCFYHFGWEILQDLKNVGFDHAYAVFVWSAVFGYLGGEQVFFVASKK
jgi:SAM-dependent methyltransferase